MASLPLTACGTTHNARLDQSGAVANAHVNEPDDTVVRKAVKEYLAVRNAPASSQYEYVRQDLDGDGRREAIIMFESPFYSWCNDDGCRVVIFKAADDHFLLSSEIAPVRGPLLVSNTRTRGWRDLVVRLSGRSHEVSRDVVLKYDGKAYPYEPDLQPALPPLIQLANINGTQIFP